MHPEFTNAIIGARMVIKMSPAEAKKAVETAIDKLGEKASLQDIIIQVLTDRQALAAQVARANEIFAASVNAGAGSDPAKIDSTVILPSDLAMQRAVGAPRMPAGGVGGSQSNTGFNPTSGQAATLKMLTTFKSFTSQYPTGFAGKAEGQTFVNGLGFAIVQSGPIKWRLYTPNKVLVSVYDNEQEACDAIFKTYFSR
jgi:hypothetical protein